MKTKRVKIYKKTIIYYKFNVLLNNNVFKLSYAGISKINICYYTICLLVKICNNKKSNKKLTTYYNVVINFCHVGIPANIDIQMTNDLTFHSNTNN